MIFFESGNEFAALLATKEENVLAEGLKKLRSQLSVHGKQPKDIEYSRYFLLEYLQSNADLQHLTDLWQTIDDGSNSLEYLRIPLMQVTSLIIKALKFFPTYQGNGSGFCVRLVERHFKLVTSYLNNSSLEQVEAALHFCTSICSFSASAAKVFLSTFDLGMKCFGSFLSSKVHTGKEIKSLMICLICCLMEHNDSQVKAKVFDQMDLFCECFGGMLFLPEKVVLRLLTMLKEGVFEDVDISRSTKISLFHSGKRILDDLLKLYQHKSDQIVSFLDCFMHQICTTPGKYLCFPDNGWNENEKGKVFNPVLLKVIRMLDPLSSVRMGNLLVAILGACPELQKHYWKDTHFFYAASSITNDQVPLRLIVSLSLATKFLSLPPPAIDLAQAVDVEAITLACIPSALTKTLSKLFLHESSMVKYFNVLLCIQLFMKFEAISKLIPKGETLDDLTVAFRRQLPDYQLVFNYLQLVKGKPLAAAQTLKLINLYCEYFSDEVKFDPFKYLIEASKGSMQEEEAFQLLSLLGRFPAKLLERREKTILAHLFAFLLRFPRMKERFTALMYANSSFVGIFEHAEDVESFLEVAMHSPEESCQFLEASLSEYFKSKGTKKASFEKFPLNKQFKHQLEDCSVEKYNQLQAKYLNQSFWSNCHTINACKFLLKWAHKTREIGPLCLARNIFLSCQSPSSIVGNFANDEFVVKNLDFLFPFVEILASFEVDQTSFLISTLHSQLEEAIRNKQQVSFIWTAFLSQCTSFVLERFSTNEILECISLPTGELFGLDCFEFLRAKIQQNAPLSIPFVLNAVTSDLKRSVEIAELLIQRPNFSSDPLFNALLQNHFSVFKLCREKSKEFERFWSEGQVDDAESLFSYCPAVKPSLSDEEKFELVSRFNGTLSAQDVELFSLFQTYEKKGNRFGEALMFFGSNSSKHWQFTFVHQEMDLNSVLLEAISCLSLLQETISNFPNLTQDNYNPEFLLPWLTMLLERAQNLENEHFIRSFVEVHALSFLIVCLSSDRQSHRQQAATALSFFWKLLQRFTNKFVYLTVCLDNFKSLIETPDVNTALSSFTCHFFAKAIWVMRDAGDVMFPTLCKLFLKSALFDCERIPVFFDLLHSTDRNSRLWMLKLLRDGLKDEISYRMYKVKNVFQLMMNLVEPSYLDNLHRELAIGILSNALSMPGCGKELVEQGGIIAWFQIMLQQKFSIKLKVSLSKAALKAIQTQGLKEDMLLFDQFVTLFNLVVPIGDFELNLEFLKQLLTHEAFRKRIRISNIRTISFLLQTSGGSQKELQFLRLLLQLEDLDEELYRRIIRRMPIKI